VSEPKISARTLEISPDCVFGDDVIIEADEVRIAPGCKIGWSGDDDFRTPGGVRIRVRRLELGPGVTLGRALRMEGGNLVLDEGVRVLRESSIRVLDMLHLGAYGTVGEQGEISGRDVRIGQELWMLPQAKIGGGSAFETDSRLDAGHYLHLGMHTLLNTARPVVIGHEVGLGTRTSIYTHGAYPSRLMGFPVAFAGVTIGDFTWVPGATINPGVRIGKNCVIGVNSLVTADIPDGSLAGGSPAKVIRERYYPRPLTPEAKLAFFAEFLADYARVLGVSAQPRAVRDVAVVLDTDAAVYVMAVSHDEQTAELLQSGRRTLLLADGASVLPVEPELTCFDTRRKCIGGGADGLSARLVNQLRRYGIRFYSRPKDGSYVDWTTAPGLAGDRHAQ
jgi:carbonic anhydrase/acetyltransferase-like protein (isoleucine patch superfamily)